MRLLRKLRRKQAAHFLPFDHKNIERLENGRGNISVEQFKLFQDVYGFTESWENRLASMPFLNSPNAPLIGSETVMKNARPKTRKISPCNIRVSVVIFAIDNSEVPPLSGRGIFESRRHNGRLPKGQFQK